MKILAFSDTHGQTTFEQFETHAKDADLVLVVGDISVFGSGLQEALAGLNTLGERIGKPIILTHGNHDGPLGQHIHEQYEHIIYLHLAAMHADTFTIAGYGGDGFSEQDPVFAQFIDAVHSDELQDTVIWIMHGPPKGLGVDIVPEWGETGNQTKTDAIRKHKPRLVVCGHIHECEGEYSTVGDTLVVNAGEKGLLIDLHANTVRMIE